MTGNDTLEAPATINKGEKLHQCPACDEQGVRLSGAWIRYRCSNNECRVSEYLVET